MYKTVGLLAHVDAGKTTLGEQLLYHAGVLRSRGRVDRGSAFLDHHPLERQRGITIFSDQARFQYGGDHYTLVDTPGHTDFAAEMERALWALDYAVLVVSCPQGVQGHTETLWRLLERRGLPAFFFLNKTDLPGADSAGTLAQIRRLLTGEAVDFTGHFAGGTMDESLAEAVAERDDALLGCYLEGGYEREAFLRVARRLVGERRLFPCFAGAALPGAGVEGFLEGLHLLTETRYDPAAPLLARVCQVRRDAQGNRLSFIKVEAGSLRVKQGVGQEKVNELRFYSGPRWEPAPLAPAGSLCAATGLSLPVGQLLAEQAGAVAAVAGEAPRGAPMLTARVLFGDNLAASTVLSYLRALEEEDPALRVRFVEESGEISVGVMGPIQLEVLAQLARARFGVSLAFGECRVLYRETILAPVTGYGHFEPLRHYAEVHLRLSPGDPGTGTVFESVCPTDVLEASWQRLIGGYVRGQEHRGVLTGAPLTDVRVTLLTGRAHQKHTQGGDFGEAVRRAVRQGLMQARCALLEPWYRFELRVPAQRLGRALADIQRMGGSCEPPAPQGETAFVCGRAPVAEMMGYAQQVAAYSGGRGALTLGFGGYAPCHNAREIIEAAGYDPAADSANPAGSIFCAHGAGYAVPWQRAREHMHCPGADS